MKLFGKVLALFLLLIVLLAAAGYGFLHTSLAAQWLAALINRQGNGQVQFSSLTYRLSTPRKLILSQLQLYPPKPASPTSAQSSAPAWLSAEQATIIFTPFSPHGLIDQITFQQGQLHLPLPGGSLPVAASRWQLQAMRLIHQGNHPWQADGVSGEIRPLSASDWRFTLQGRRLDIHQIASADWQAQGHFQQGTLSLDHLWADIFRGTLQGSAIRHADGRWQVRDMQLDHWRLQTDQSLADLWQTLSSLPAVQIDQITVNRARLEGKRWAINDLTLNARNLALAKSTSQHGQLSLNASDLVAGGVHLISPALQLAFTPEGVNLEKLDSEWQKGRIQAAGQWDRARRALTLDKLTVNGLEYALPAGWRQRWQPPPRWLRELSVRQLSASRNLIIDPDPAFPWQLTNLAIQGEHWRLIQNGQWGLWQGEARIIASSATFNRIDLRQPIWDWQADAQSLQSQWRSQTAQGEFNAHLRLCQCPAQDFTLTFTGRHLPENLLTQWGWASSPIPPDSDIVLNLQGQLHHARPLPASLTGTLQITEANGKQSRHPVQPPVAPDPLVPLPPAVNSR